MPDTPPSSWPSAAFYDGGEAGCGKLLLDLLLFTRRQPAGAVINVGALNPGALTKPLSASPSPPAPPAHHDFLCTDGTYAAVKRRLGRLVRHSNRFTDRLAFL